MRETEKGDLVQPGGRGRGSQDRLPREGDVELVLKEVRDLRKGAGGGERHSEQGNSGSKGTKPDMAERA